MTAAFELTGVPDICFGPGTVSILPERIRKYGNNALLVLGSQSFQGSPYWDSLQKELKENNIRFHTYNVDSEPTPRIVDAAVEMYRDAGIDVLVSIGGGSVIDAGKAISAMLTVKDPVINYLEGVGDKEHNGSKIPFIALPTTSGTGSEATKNAVICERGGNGFKKSLRHEKFVPDLAIIDPALTLGCPENITTLSGLDAFSQLLESYTSIKASAFTDSIALEAIRCISRSLLKVCWDGGDLAARTDMSYAALISGITLANAGLGLIHGLASTIGGLYDIPHGAICGNLLEVINRANIDKLLDRDKEGVYLKKYAEAGRIFSVHDNKSNEYYALSLADSLDEMVSDLNVAGFTHYISEGFDIDKIISLSGHKNNPVILQNHEIEKALLQRL